MWKLIAVVLCVLQCGSGCLAQGVTLTKKQSAIRQMVQGLAPQARISVVLVNAPEEFGTYVSSDDQVFTFYDLDQKANVTLSYTAVKKVKAGLGGYNSLTQRHTDVNRTKLVVFTVVIALSALIGVAALSR